METGEREETLTPSANWTPDGYCPVCGYRISPGQCPECGAQVRREEILSSPSWVYRRRIIKRFVILAAVLALIIGPIEIYRDTDWPAWLPTSVLLAVYDGPESRTGAELWARLAGGTLTSKQTADLLHKSVSISDRLEIRSPHPTGHKLLAAYSIDSHFRKDFGAEPSTFRVEVDGKPCQPDPDRWSGALYGGPIELNLGARIPPLNPGRHTILLEAKVLLCGPRGRSGPTVLLRTAGEVQVENRPLNEYVTPVWHEEDSGKIKEALFAKLKCERADSPNAYVGIHVVSCPFPIASRLWIRTGDNKDFSPVDCWFVAAQGVSRSHVVPIPRGLNAEGRQTIDIKLVPDAGTAFDAGLSEYLGCTIEWRDVPVSGPGFASWNVKPDPDARHPDLVTISGK